MNEEIWKVIEGYSIYMISNLGNVKHLNYRNTKKEKLMIQRVNNSGYMRVGLLSDEKIRKDLFIHRLVATAFVQNSNTKPIVNHLDGNKLNNTASNLEWVTKSENEKHAYKAGLKKVNKTGLGKLGELHHHSKPVLQFSLNGDFIAEYESVTNAMDSTGVKKISMACNGLRKTAGGFVWGFKNNYADKDDTSGTDTN